MFKSDRNLQIFLEYEKDLNVRGKNKKEKLAGFLQSFQKTGDELLLNTTVKDVDDFFEKEKHFLVEFQSQLKETTTKADKMTALHRGLAYNYIKQAQNLRDLGALEGPDSPLGPFLTMIADSMEKMRRIEGRVASDQDLKLSDLLRYQSRDITAAKDLLYRRIRCLANYENANKNLERARTKNRDVIQAEAAQLDACNKFESISAQAKEELKTLRDRRNEAFKKGLTDLAELELKHAKAHAQMLRTCLATLRNEEPVDLQQQ